MGMALVIKASTTLVLRANWAITCTLGKITINPQAHYHVRVKLILVERNSDAH